MSEGIELMLGDTGTSLSSALLSFSLLLRVSSLDTLSKTLELTLGVLELLPKKLLALLRGLCSSIFSGSLDVIARVEDRRDNAVDPVIIADCAKGSNVYARCDRSSYRQAFFSFVIDLSIFPSRQHLSNYAPCFKILRSSERDISCYKDQERAV